MIRMRDWLQAEGCTHVGMESTGVYWMPVYTVLEGQFDLIVGNATLIKQVPGRKTCVKDSECIRPAGGRAEPTLLARSHALFASVRAGNRLFQVRDRYRSTHLRQITDLERL